MENTKQIADEIVATLKNALPKTALEELDSVESVFLMGSYIRGDWLNINSDLDITILFEPTSKGDRRSYDFKKIKELIYDSPIRTEFVSQCNGGIDWGKLDFLPEEQDLNEITGFFHYNVFYFDFITNIEILWGEDFIEKLPVFFPSVERIEKAMAFILSKVIKEKDHFDKRKMAFGAYKFCLMLQLCFGELTIDKREILGLFNINVPDFPGKKIGSDIIPKSSQNLSQRKRT